MFLAEVLKCREDTWKLVEKTDFSDYTKMCMYDLIRRGRYSVVATFDFLREGLEKTVGKKRDDIRDDLENILYIFPISHAIEHFEYRKELFTE